MSEAPASAGEPLASARVSWWGTLLLTFVAVVGLGGWLFREEIYWDQAQVDFATYLQAFERVEAGRDPYVDRAFVYTPAFAVLGAAADEALGRRRFMVAFRWGCLLGVWLLAAVTLAAVRWPWHLRLAGALLIAWSPLVANGMGCANATLLIAGPLVLALWMAEAHPLLGGVAGGTLDAWKPLGVTALALVAVPREGWRPARWAVTMLGSAAISAALWLLVGWRRLPVLLGRMEGFPTHLMNISLHRALAAMGLRVPAIVPFLVVTAAGALVVRRWARDHASRVAVALAFGVVALPVNNPSTFVLALPAQALAIDRAWRRWRRWRRLGRAGRGLAELGIVAAAVLGVQGVEGAVGNENLPPFVRGLVTLVPLLETAGLAFYAAGAGAAAAPARGVATATPAIPVT